MYILILFQSHHCILFDSYFLLVLIFGNYLFGSEQYQPLQAPVTDPNFNTMRNKDLDKGKAKFFISISFNSETVED